MIKSDNLNRDTPSSLPPILDEFRTALLDEIEVAKRNATNSSIQLNNGHKIGEQGNSFQYTFLIDNILNTPDGTPCDFIIPGRVPMQVTIVSTEGLRIVISVENDLGQFVPTARLQTNLSVLLRKLIERIEKNAYVDNPAASRMLGITTVAGNPKKPMHETSLNPEQNRALESALGRNLTVIWGPPGTGKTFTIGTITEHLYKSGRTILIISHTNTAVDQAIKHVAKSLEEHIEQGSVIRVGEVRDQELKIRYPDVLLKRQVERQSQQLVDHKEALTKQKQLLFDELNEINRKISIIKWLEATDSDINTSKDNIEKLHELENQLRSYRKQLEELINQKPRLIELYKITTRVLEINQKIEHKREQVNYCNGQLLNIENRIDTTKMDLQQQLARLEIANRLAPLKLERTTYPSLEEQKNIIENLLTKISELEKECENVRDRYNVESNVLSQIKNMSTFKRIVNRLPKPDEQKTIVDGLVHNFLLLETEINANKKAHSNAVNKLSRIIELDAELSRYEDISSKDEEHQKLIGLQDLLQKLENLKTSIKKDISSLNTNIAVLEDEKREVGSIDGDVIAINQEVHLKLDSINNLQIDIMTFQHRIDELRKVVNFTLNRLLNQVLRWVSVSEKPVSEDEKFNFVRICHQQLTEQQEMSELSSLKGKVDSLNYRIRQLTGEITQVDEQLAQVERNIIKNASIIGATLTKTYLSDDIQSRKFDTVILDEASMAPIPALWVAALLSVSNLIIVGDFKQLPPIVLSNREFTKKWLGRDIFEASGLKKLWDEGTPPDYFIMLKEQRRFLPEIASVANLFYDHKLQTRLELDNRKFLSWYKSDWLYDNPVVLVDTGSLNAWVTSVVKNGNSSRLNFLSAAISVDLAEQLLRSDRKKVEEGDPARILIVSPYRAHAKLVKLLIQENLLIQSEVISGTAHSFQGSEADVVIFDLVADEPHFRVNLFMPELDDQIRPLLNVALTRTKFRLFVIGDFNYCRSHGKKAFLGRTLIPFLLRNYPRINASDLVPNGLAAKVAKVQITMMGGEIEANSDRVVVTHADFFRLLSSDFSRATKSIVIYSPFITQDRVGFLIPQLQAAISRGVSVVIITKALSERSVSELSQIRKIEDQLSEIGAIVMHKMHMHEKLVFIDHDLTWSGSLNPLSYSHTQEVMERRKSKAVLDDYFQILRLNDLLAVLGKVESKCPICGSEMIAAEGADQPYYWRCINDNCYSRSIDQPYPFDGVLSCGTCNASVEFGYWGDYPHWRCTVNARHRQKIFKSHLRLPKMVALIPRGERRKIFKMFGINDARSEMIKYDDEELEKDDQITLFDDSK